MIQWRKGNFWICAPGECRARRVSGKVHVDGLVGVHKRADGWRATHLGTGLGMLTSRRGEDAAKAEALRLLPDTYAAAAVSSKTDRHDAWRRAIVREVAEMYEDEGILRLDLADLAEKLARNVCHKLSSDLGEELKRIM